MRALLPCLLLLAGSCSGGATQIPMSPVPAKATSGMLAGNLCTADGCKCRDLTAPGDGGVGVPEAGKKRFEIRLGPSSQPLWATLPTGAGTTVLYKSPERADACFYVDLTPGVHPMELRASAPEGVSAQWSIHEYGQAAGSWYDTFNFNCGAPGVCSFTELDDAKPRYAAVKKGVHDRCGSTRIKSLTWDTGKAPDQLHPSELVVRVGVDVRKFMPTQAHGDSTCGLHVGSAGDDDLPPPATVTP
jgi:hypothetical protein